MGEQATPADRRRLSIFDRFAEAASEFASHAVFFIGCALVVVLWLPSYFLIGNLNTWQLIINTLTTIITFSSLRFSRTHSDAASRRFRQSSTRSSTGSPTWCRQLEGAATEETPSTPTSRSYAQPSELSKAATEPACARGSFRNTRPCHGRAAELGPLGLMSLTGQTASRCSA